MNQGSFQPGTAGGSMTSCVELAVVCKNLADKDVLSKSDPQCVLFTKQFAKQQWVEFGRTEIISDQLNPQFVKKFMVDYFFEERQLLKFQLYDVDSPKAALSHHDFLGEMECSLGEIVSNGKLSRKLTGPNVGLGTITVCAEELASCKEEVTLQFEGRKLDKKDFFGKSDPFLRFYKVNEDNTFTVVHKTEVLKNTLDPKWKPFTLPVRTLCAGDHNRVLLVKCYDWNSDGSEDLIGEFRVTLTEMVSQPNQTWECINPDKKARKGKKYRNSGAIALLQCRLVETPSFIDYVHSGTQLACTIGIDFTASNGNPSQTNSLHYISAQTPNHYERAIVSVGEIVQDYDSDKLFPTLGFGAKIPPEGRVSHEFFVNGDASSPFCAGVGGVLDAYRRCIRQVQLYGPTNFAPIINHVARFAAHARDGSEYFILLILTDGVITDMPQTRDAIVAASSLPLSIIIVGVGQAEFDAMEELDGDNVRLTNQRGQPAQRDIVQFVPFRQFVQGQSAQDMSVSQARLAKEVLAEIPDQFLSYMKVNRITPGSWYPGGVRPPPAPQANMNMAPASAPALYPNPHVNSSAPPPPAPMNMQQPATAPDWYNQGQGDAQTKRAAPSPPPPYPGYPGQ